MVSLIFLYCVGFLGMDENPSGASPGNLNSDGYPSGGLTSVGSYGLYGAFGGTQPFGLGLLLKSSDIDRKSW